MHCFCLQGKEARKRELKKVHIVLTTIILDITVALMTYSPPICCLSEQKAEDDGEGSCPEDERSQADHP